MPEARLGAEVLLAAALGTDRVGLYLAFDRPVSEPEKDRFRELIRRRSQREPVAYIVGEKEFFSLAFEVGPAVLIPRPETELLVERAVAELDEPGIPRVHDKIILADVGAGSGAVACAIAKEREGVFVAALEVSRDASRVAARNVEIHGLSERVGVVVSDLLAPFGPGSFSLVVSNPPYVPAGVIPTLAEEIGFEPKAALDGGADGLSTIRRLVSCAGEGLAPGGRLIIEIGEGQAEDARGIFSESGFKEIRLFKDLGGVERVIRGVFHG